MDEQEEADLYELLVSFKKKLLKLEAAQIAFQELVSEAEKKGLLSAELRVIVSKFPARRDEIWGASTAAIEDSHPGLSALLDEGREEPPSS